MTNENKATIQLNEKAEKEFFKVDYAAAKFRQLWNECFKRRFGKTRKADIELFMFSAYIDVLINEMAAELKGVESSGEDENEKSKRKDAIVQSFMRETSDTNLSIKLGAMPTTIRGLKQKKLLDYKNENYDWTILFAHIKNKIDVVGEMVRIHISDAMLLQEITNFLEDKGGYIEKEITPNLIKVTPENFIRLLIAVEGEKEQESLNKRIDDFGKKKNIDYVQLSKGKDAFGKIMAIATSQEAETCVQLLSILPVVGSIGKTAFEIAKVLKKCITTDIVV